MQVKGKKESNNCTERVTEKKIRVREQEKDGKTEREREREIERERKIKLSIFNPIPNISQIKRNLPLTKT